MRVATRLQNHAASAVERSLDGGRAMQLLAQWDVDSKKIELLHEDPRGDERGHWEFRVDGEVRMYGYGRPREARTAVYTRRKLT